MESTAVSLGMAVLVAALGYAKSGIEGELALHFGVERDVAFIGDELEMMQSFLMTADEEQDKNKVLLTWVNQVREVAYNVEDGLMDFSVRFGSNNYCLLYCPHILWGRRSIANEMKELKAKVEDVSNRNQRYRLIKGSASRTTTTEMEQASIDVAAMSGTNKERRMAIEQEHSKAYENKVVYEMFGCRAWVKLTSPFNTNDFLRSLLRQFSVHSREVIGKEIQGKAAGYDVLKKLEGMQLSRVADKVSKYVHKKRYLIVIDDVSTVVEWDWIKTYFPNQKNGSRVIVSMQQVEVARLCLEEPSQSQVTDMKQLSPDQSIYLFHNKVETRSTRLSSSDGDNLTILMPSGSQEIEETEQQMPPGCGNHQKEAEDLIGRTKEKDDIIDLICRATNGPKVLSVWGMGGVGKTTLMRSVYKSKRLRDWKCAWITVLRPFNCEAIFRSLASQLQIDITVKASEGSTEEKEKIVIRAMNLQELITAIILLLEKQKCLIVVDDLSFIEEWNSIKNTLAKSGCVIVTTRDKLVAKHCSTGDDNIYSLHRLDDHDALMLFKKKVFKDDKVPLCPEMLKQANLILKKCDGLPLEISTIGGFLATKPKTTTEWRMTYDRISIDLEIIPELREAKTVLFRSYDGLTYYLKSCFLYLSIFPEDHQIRRKRVVRRWVAEGYSREMHGMSAEEVGDMYFDELLDRSMILPGEDVNNDSGKIVSCKLHDIMRQICILKAREENLCLTLEKECSSSMPRGAIRHLAISSNWEIDKDVFEGILDLLHLRSLTVFGEWRSFFISSKMRFLRALDLEGTSNLCNHHLEKIGELIHLKYLSLRGCWGISQLPFCLGNLRKLERLDAKGIEIFNLPNTIKNLRKLKYLRAVRFNDPTWIGKLNGLHTLGSVNVNHGIGSLKSLKPLTKLRKLGVYGVTATNNHEFWSVVAGLSRLQSLLVNWDHAAKDEVASSLDKNLSPPRSIERLKLGGRLSTFKKWINILENLSRLQLQETELDIDDIKLVGNLPNLAILQMWEKSFKGKELTFETGSFPSLILLVFHDLRCVTLVEFKNGAMPKLDTLRACGSGEAEEDVGLRNVYGTAYIQRDRQGFGSNIGQKFLGLEHLMKLKEIQLGSRISKEFKENVEAQLPNAILKLV
ncbi:unnamed protein product [Urochloa decumbens]|uniref:Uncharacterized protein n=1 Tax=Urochloa decumbens TaxID=240449 RepID=A0ABC9BLK7_9POAL